MAVAPTPGWTPRPEGARVLSSIGQGAARPSVLPVVSGPKVVLQTSRTPAQLSLFPPPSQRPRGRA